MKKSKGYFIKLPEGFKVSVPSRLVPEDDHFEMTPSGLYITHNVGRLWVHYAGEQAGESQAVFELPSEPVYLRKLAKELTNLAKQIESERT
jgi:hypothetical protein